MAKILFCIKVFLVKTIFKLLKIALKPDFPWLVEFFLNCYDFVSYY